MLRGARVQWWGRVTTHHVGVARLLRLRAVDPADLPLLVTLAPALLDVLLPGQKVLYGNGDTS